MGIIDRTTTEGAAFVQAWSERSAKATLEAKAARLRTRVEETYFEAKIGKLPAMNMCRRALVDAESLLDIADEALRRDWRGG